MISTIMIGNGGREDSLRWKLEKENIPINENSKFVIIGPEGPIADGLTEHYEGMHKKVFAPSKLAGRLETSKLWAKQFMLRNDIPTAKWETYDRSTIEEAIIRPNDKFPIVIKEDGLFDEISFFKEFNLFITIILNLGFFWINSGCVYK